jgi:hypothetical protein
MAGFLKSSSASRGGMKASPKEKKTMANLSGMTYDSRDGKYYGYLSDGTLIAVDGDVYAEQEQAGLSEAELTSPATWENYQDGERVYIVPQNSPKYWGR